MAKVTKETVFKMNKQLSNGFLVNIQQLCMNEKMAVKKIVLDENRYLLASLWFGADYENYRKVAHTIELNIALYTKEKGHSDVFVSQGLGYNETLEKGLKRKMWKDIAKYSEQVGEALILEVYEKHKSQMTFARIV